MKKSKKTQRRNIFLFAALLLGGLLSAQTITTIAGGVQGGFAGDGGSVISSQLNGPHGVCTDTSGNIYIAEWHNNRIRKIDKVTGNISTVVGTGVSGFAGDGGPATSAQLNSPVSVVVDKAGNIYISDLNNYRIRKVNASTGNITTLAGTGTGTYTGDGGPSIAAGINGPYGLCLDTAGNLYFADSGNNAVRKISKTTGNISTVAGNGIAGYSGDGSAATFAKLTSPQAVYVDAPGNIYITDAGNKVVRKVNVSTGIINTIAGTGMSGYTGDGGPALSAKFGYPTGIALNTAGDIFISDNGFNVIRKVDAVSGNISTVAGNGTLGYTGDFGPATAALLNSPKLMCFDKQGDLLLCDFDNERLRKISAGNGTITTVAGAVQGGFAGDGGPAIVSELNDPWGIAMDTSGNIYISEWKNNRIRKITKSTGIISTVAGNGTGGFGGDGGAATSAMLYSPTGIAVDIAGNIYISDLNNYRIRKVTKSTGIISTIAGNGTGGYTGDGGLATAAQINSPYGLGLDTAGNLYISDYSNNAIRRINKSTGNITTVAGNGTAGYSGDGSAATLAKLNAPQGVYIDASNNLFIADKGNSVIRKVSATTGLMSTFAGNGTPGFSGDNGSAVSAQLSSPESVAGDAAGNIFIADWGNSVIRAVKASTGKIYTIAGKPNVAGYSGDGGYPAAALLNYPNALYHDNASHLYISDENNNRIREMDASLLTIGLHEQNNERRSFALFPNPSNGEISINLTASSERGTVEVFNTMGMLVFRSVLNEGNLHRFNFSQLEKGLYVMRVAQAGEVSCKQFLLN